MTTQEDKIETCKFLLSWYEDVIETGNLHNKQFVTSYLKVPDDTPDADVLTILNKRINTVKTSIKFGI